jgi:hypothetical protein
MRVALHFGEGEFLYPHTRPTLCVVTAAAFGQGS